MGDSGWRSRGLRNSDRTGRGGIAASASAARATSSCFLLGLNTSTIRGQKLSCASGFQVMLSLELFNRQYWKEDPLTVARTGLRTMKAGLVAASEQEPA